MPVNRVSPPHPTDANSKHDDLYYPKATADAALALKADAADLDTILDGSNNLVPAKVEAAVESYGGPTGADWTANQAAIARVDPGTLGNEGEGLIVRNGVPAYYPRGYRLVDEYSSLAAAIADLPATGGELVFRGDATYVVPDTGIPAKAKLSLLAKGSRSVQLIAPSTATATAMLDLAAITAMRIEGLDFNGNLSTTMTKGIYALNSAEKDLVLEDVIVRNFQKADFGAYGIDIWRARNVWMNRVTAISCNNGIHLQRTADTTIGQGSVARLMNVKSYGTDPTKMRWGLRFGSDITGEDSSIEVYGAYANGAQADPAANGSGAHGISAWRCRGLRIIGGEVENCGDPVSHLGAGVLLSLDMYGTVVDGVVSHDNYAPAFYTELASADVTIGTDGSPRGATLSNCVGHSSYRGFNNSFAAGVSFENCRAYDNDRDGLLNDSDRVTVNGGFFFNNWRDAAAPAPANNDGVKGGVRSYSGAGVVITGVQAWDSNATKLQQYGVVVDQRGHIIANSNLSGNLTGGLYESGAVATANTKTGNVGA